MPAPTIKKILRMTGRVDIYNEIHHDVVVRAEQFNNTIYVPSPANTGPDISVGNHVVFLDRRGGTGFKRSESLMAPARIFGMVQKGREPVLYVMMGIAPSRPVPEEQADAQAAAQRTSRHSQPRHS